MINDTLGGPMPPLSELLANIAVSDPRPTEPPMPATLEDAMAKIADLSAKLDYLIGFSNAIYPKAGQRVMWQDKVTKSGITLDGTTATADVEGVLLGACFLPTGPSSGTALMICRPNGQQVVTVLDSTKVRFLDE